MEPQRYSHHKWMIMMVPRFAHYSMDLKYHEFVVAGAGIAGMTLALLLNRAGESVVVMEKRPKADFLEEELRVPTRSPH